MLKLFTVGGNSDLLLMFLLFISWKEKKNILKGIQTESFSMKFLYDIYWKIGPKLV